MKKYYAVIDTNVLVSSFIKEKSLPWWIIHFVKEKVIIPLLHQDIVDEYKEVLSRNKFGLDETAIQTIIDSFITNGVFLEKTDSSETFTDSDDVVFYEIVLTGRKTSDAYLVTGNKRHFPIIDFVVSPSEMIEILKNDGVDIS